MTTKLQLLTAHQGAAISTPNRIALAPMTRNRAGESRVANAMMGTYYAQRATAGLLISESVDVSPRAIGYPGTPGLYSPAMVEGWKIVVDAVRAAQTTPAPFFCQLFHTGRVSHGAFRDDGTPGVAPSAIRAEVDLYTPAGMQPAAEPEALTEAGIQQTIVDYVGAARGAIEAGFDGVELNCGNGYLLHQFLADGTNQRTDAWGGSVENRIRLVLAIVDAIGEAIGHQRVAVRVSPINTTNGVTDSDPSAVYPVLAGELEGRGIAYLHVIEAADNCTITPQMRERFSGTLVVNDGYDRERAEWALESGLADIVSFGRAFLANPDLPRRLELGAPLNEPDMATFYGGAEPGYIDYPTLEEVESEGARKAG